MPLIRAVAETLSAEDVAQVSMTVGAQDLTASPARNAMHGHKEGAPLPSDDGHPHLATRRRVHPPGGKDMSGSGGLGTLVQKPGHPQPQSNFILLLYLPASADDVEKGHNGNLVPAARQPAQRYTPGIGRSAWYQLKHSSLPRSDHQIHSGRGGGVLGQSYSALWAGSTWFSRLLA